MHSAANHEWLQWKQCYKRHADRQDRQTDETDRQTCRQTDGPQIVHTLCWGVIASTRPTKIRWETSSSHAYANPGAFAGRSMCNTLLPTQILHITKSCIKYSCNKNMMTNNVKQEYQLQQWKTNITWTFYDFPILSTKCDVSHKQWHLASITLPFQLLSTCYSVSYTHLTLPTIYSV